MTASNLMEGRAGIRVLTAHCRRADMLVAAMGVPQFVKPGVVKPGAVVIDVGVNRMSDPAGRRGKAGGRRRLRGRATARGPYHSEPRRRRTRDIAWLMHNTVRAAELAQGRS